MSSIGGISQIAIKGPPLGPMGQMVEVFTRSGVDGVAARQLGLRPGINQPVSVTDAEDSDDVQTLKAAYAAMRGTLVTVIDDHGETFDNVLVQDVRVDAQRAVAGGGGGPRVTSEAPGYLVYASWVLMVTELPS